MARPLVLTDGRPLQVLNRGVHNHGVGPDFLQAKLVVDQTTWIGSVEMHVKSSDWLLHGHQNDPQYQAVILHVVWKHDQELLYNDGTPIPVLELQNQVEPERVEAYKTLVLESLQGIPCKNHIQYVDSITVYQMIQNAVVHRLKRKTERLKTLLNETQQDWNTVFYRQLFRNMGFKTNEHAFEAMAERIHPKILQQMNDKPRSCEALLLGVANLLQDTPKTDAYIEDLKNEYLFLEHKYNLKPIPHGLWKFGKLRPHNFPYVRIAQLASLLNQNNHLFSRVLEAQKVSDLLPLFSSQISEYWIRHIKPAEQTHFTNTNLSHDAVDLILVNTCVPVVFLYGEQTQNPDLQQKALEWLEEIKPENNRYIKAWKALGIKPAHCLESQGLIELYESFCSAKKCMECSIGFKILKSVV